MPNRYPYSKSERPELFDRVCGAPAEAGGAGSPPPKMTGVPNGAFGYTAFANRCLRGLIPAANARCRPP